VITLAADCLLFELPGGESIPYSADMVWVELEGGTTGCSIRSLSGTPRRLSSLLQTRVGPPERAHREFAGRWRRCCAASRSARRFRLHRTRSRTCWTMICVGWRMNLARAASLSSFRACGPNYSGILAEPACAAISRLRGCVSSSPARVAGPALPDAGREIVDYLRQCLSAEPALTEFACCGVNGKAG